MDWKFEKNMYPILDTRVLIQKDVKLQYLSNKSFTGLRALLIQNGMFKIKKTLRGLF